MAGNWGGGIHKWLGGTLILENTTISSNSAEEGGGIYAESGVVEIMNATISGNTAMGTSAAGGNESGGGIVNAAAQVSLENTIVAGNSGGECAGTFISLGFNLDGGTSCGLSMPSDLSDSNAMLGPLQDNEGPTLTHALLYGSPAIDAGPAKGCPASDQRGLLRPVDGDGDGSPVCDIGAFEVQVALGDVNCDGEIDPIDAALVLQHTAGLVPSLSCQAAGDASQDGAINAIDAALILQFVAELLPGLPP
jgi:predicted outer membrane repeat protein